MGTDWRRRVMAIAVFAIALCPLAIGGQSAAAFPEGDTVLPFSYNIDATTHIKKFDQTINIVGGTFVGGIDLSDGTLVGAIALPPAQFTFRVAGIVPLVTATARIVPKAPVVGHLDIYNPNLPITATSVFNIRILEAHAEGTTLNLVGDYCRTASVVTVTMSGNASLASSSTLSGEYTIPNFVDCGLAVTQALDLAISGPGNTFTATSYPS